MKMAFTLHVVLLAASAAVIVAGTNEFGLKFLKENSGKEGASVLDPNNPTQCVIAYPAPHAKHGDAKFSMDTTGVVTLSSGVQHRSLRKGPGYTNKKLWMEFPTSDTECEVHFESRVAENHPDGPKVFSTYDSKQCSSQSSWARGSIINITRDSHLARSVRQWWSERFILQTRPPT